MSRRTFITVDGRKELPDSFSVNGTPDEYKLYFAGRLPKGLGRRSEVERAIEIHVAGGKRVLSFKSVVLNASRKWLSVTLRRTTPLTKTDSAT